MGTDVIARSHPWEGDLYCNFVGMQKKGTPAEEGGMKCSHTTILARLRASDARWDIVAEGRMVFEPEKATLDSKHNAAYLLCSSKIMP